MGLNVLLVLISTILYVVSFPLWNAGFAAFFALVPLFWAIERARSIPRAMGYGVVWGALVSAGMGYWLLPTLVTHFGIRPPLAGLFFLASVILPVCLIYAFLVAVYRFVHHRHLAWYAIVVPSLWILAEYVKEMIPVLIPWGGIGYAAMPFHRYVQIADLGGVHGLTGVIVSINAVMWYMVRSVLPMSVVPRKSLLRVNCSPAIVLILAVCLPLVYGHYRLSRIDEAINEKASAGQQVQAILVQGNFDLDERWSGMGFYRRLQTYLEMSTENSGDMGAGNAEDRKSRVIVWPETTLNEPARLSGSLFRQIMSLIGDDALLVSGGLNQDDATGQVTNCAYLVSGEGALTRYDKRILLPYAETTMLVDWLGQYYTAPSEFAPGRIPPSMETPHGKVGMSICFEILYPGYIAGSVNSGASLLINMSNDAWFGDSPMPYMHLNAARMRAIENRRFLLRAANSGVSAVIAPSGQISARTDLFHRQRIDGDFVHLDVITPYTRYGDWLVFFSGCMLAVALLRVAFAKE